MKLNLKDRLIIINILPKKGDYTSLVVKNDLIAKIQITQEEIIKYKITSIEGGGLKWEDSEESRQEAEIELTELETKMIQESLDELDKKKELTDETFEIYNKFKK